MNELIMFHDKALVVGLFIALFVGGSIVRISCTSYSELRFLDKKVLEFFWTVLPSITLFLLAVPSLKLLYFIDKSKVIGAEYTIKRVGHQWYWTKCFVINGKVIEADMYMLKGSDLQYGDSRNLETDSVIVVPAHTLVRVVVGSRDVIHRFALPSLGVKVDAVPGRLNQQYFYRDMVGVFYGQCSEICGANHRFMPITAEFYYKTLY